MRRLVVTEWMTLDGVVQAPGTADEDRSGGFEHGGWHLPYFDEMSQTWVVENVAGADAFLFGRRTYESLGGYWPQAPEEEQAIAAPLNERLKHVVSSTLAEPLSWQPASLIGGDVPAAIEDLKRDGDGYVLVIGSSQLVPLLLEHGLVDELRLMIDPLLVGGGKSAFPADGAKRPLRLVGSRVATTGAILATYAPAT
jgi:dihydrofolate reductase